MRMVEIRNLEGMGGKRAERMRGKEYRRERWVVG